MSYEPTIIASWDDLQRVASTTDYMEEYVDPDYNVESWALKEIQNQYKQHLENENLICEIKGVKLIVFNIELTSRNSAVRNWLSEWEVEYTLDN